MRVLITALLIGLALGRPQVRADDSKTKEQFWEGALKVRPGVELRLIVRVTGQREGDSSGVMESPDEGLKGLKLSSVTLDKSRFAFELKVSRRNTRES